MPDDTGPKTNPLQLLFDRYETILLCWQIGNATKDNCQIALASLKKVESFTSEHHFIPRFTIAEKVQLWHFFSRSNSVNYFNMNAQTGYHDLVNEDEIIQQWLFQGLIWSLSGCKLVNLPIFQRDSNYENLQKRKSPGALVLKDYTEPEPFLPSKWPYNIHAN